MFTNAFKSITLVAACLFASNVYAAEEWLIASQSAIINAGQTLTLEIVKPDQAAWPDHLEINLRGSGKTERLILTPIQENGTPSDYRRKFSVQPQRQYAGVVRASLAEYPSNQFLLLASTDDETGPIPVALDATEATEPTEIAESSAPRIVIAQPGEEPAMAANEPTYFVIGHNSERGADARFQLSFKYRLFDPDGSIAKFSPLFSNLFFTYTQTSLWDLGEDSSPFRDTSYRPGLMYRWAGSGQYLMPDEWRTGLEHESNGQGGDVSRSINIAYVRPSWHLDLDNGKRLTLMPRIYHYLDKKENRDIQRYRGYVDWLARYGREDGLIVSGLYRQGTGGYASGQIDLSYPIGEKIFARTGSFVYLQMFSGYGETLLEYDQDRDTQLRVGISIAR